MGSCYLVFHLDLPWLMKIGCRNIVAPFVVDA